MQLIMDSEKIRRENKLNCDKVNQAIDGLLLSEYKFIKTSDGFYLERGNANDYTNFWCAILLLKDEDWFMDNVKTWLWYNSDDSDDPDDFVIEDLKGHYSMKHKKSA